ncbi:M66 family metalloprotease [Kitasatospora sp. MBT63]|uniref:M66 family metalloprotease n=1 Tax=Kitasatospora sp. MBT63 TaxID=1444768 RepID=UPI000539DE29|nr:M66 family metalloprotease [Kitasatospora sp. MBT63]
MLNRMRQRLAAAAAAGLVSGLLLTPAPAAAAPPPVPLGLTVTVSMDWFERFEVPDSGIDEEGEFFPEVTIGDGALQTGPIVSDDAFHPNTVREHWVFDQHLTLPAGQTSLSITVGIKDDDDGLGFDDDRMDISPTNQDVELNLTYNVLTDTWFGDGIGHGPGPDSPCTDRDGHPQGQACAVGDGDPNFPEAGDGKRAALGLTITSSAHSDADQDGIADRDESYGIRNADNSTAVDLPAFGADPLHKDLFLELDHSGNTAPSHESLEVVRRSFELAPLPNPAGGNGIRLHVDSGGRYDATAMEGPPQGTCTDGIDNDGKDGADGADPDCTFRDTGVEDFKATCGNGIDDDGDGKTDAVDPDCLAGENLGGGGVIPAVDNCGFDPAFFQSKATNFAAVRQRAFNYVIYTSSHTDSDGAGPDTDCGIGGHGGGTDIVLYRNDPAALMHELGHNLGLDHGGNEAHNCKPNYVSVMNYDLNSGIPRAGGGVVVDFSPARIALDGTSRGKAPLDDLKENDLHEDRVLDPNDAVNNFVFMDDTGVKRTTPLNRNPDWNGDNPAGYGDDGAQQMSVNVDAAGPADCTNSTKDSLLTGHDDWKLVQSYLPGRFPKPGSAPPVLESRTFPTKAEADRIRAVNNTTDLSVSLTDAPDPVIAGTSLTWTVTVANHGPNPATSTRVTTTLPADVTNPTSSVPCTVTGATVTCNLSEVGLGATRQYTITADVPADLVHRNGGPKTITAGSTVDNLAGPDAKPADNTATADTKVVAVADLAVTGLAAQAPPTQLVIGRHLDVTLHSTVANLGPSSPMDATVRTDALPDPGATATPASATRTVAALAVGTPQPSDAVFSLGCDRPGSHTYRFTSSIAPARPDDTDPVADNNRRSAEFTLDCIVPVAISVEPERAENLLLVPNDTVPVAVLTTTAGEYGLPLAFDATTVQPLTARFGARDAVYAGTGGSSEPHRQGHPMDVVEHTEHPAQAVKDGDLDLLLHFDTEHSGLRPGDGEACVKGSYTDRADGRTYRFFGCDKVRVVPFP